MREIKFRAWDKKRGRMFKPTSIDYHTYKNKVLVWREPYQDERVDWCQHGFELGKEIELMQFTGIYDKNGKPVFESDILEFRSVVTYVDSSDNANLGMEVGFYSQRDNFESWRLLEVGEDLEVLGNIYENPDLLKR